MNPLPEEYQNTSLIGTVTKVEVCDTLDDQAGSTHGTMLTRLTLRCQGMPRTMTLVLPGQWCHLRKKFEVRLLEE